MNPVILANGIHTTKAEASAWMRDFGEYLRSTTPGLEVLEFKSGWISATSIRAPGVGWFMRRHYTKKLQRFVARVVKERGAPCKPNVIAHSFATWLVHYSMSRGKRRAFYDRIIYMGGVVSSRASFDDQQGHYRRVLNLWSFNDGVVRMAFLAPFGHSGFRGFRAGAERHVHGEELTPYEHGDYLKPGRAWPLVGEFLRR